MLKWLVKALLWIVGSIIALLAALFFLDADKTTQRWVILGALVGYGGWAFGRAMENLRRRIERLDSRLDRIELELQTLRNTTGRIETYIRLIEPKAPQERGLGDALFRQPKAKPPEP